jgi:methylmalonyl-CoA mutase cobalamin-binding subunit
MGRSEFDSSGFDVINGARLSPQKNVINLKTIEKTYP